STNCRRCFAHRAAAGRCARARDCHVHLHSLGRCCSLCRCIAALAAMSANFIAPSSLVSEQEIRFFGMTPQQTLQLLQLLEARKVEQDEQDWLAEHFTLLTSKQPDALDHCEDSEEKKQKQWEGQGEDEDGSDFWALDGDESGRDAAELPDLSDLAPE